jgi:hypothetical protein
MLSLDSPRWRDLQHAYGSAADIPPLLRALESLPPSTGREEPWFTLWSALAHQGDVYSASFATVPHVIRALSIAPARAHFSFFQFPAWVEICWRKKQVPIPSDLEECYFAALGQLPSLVAAAGPKEWDEHFLACALTAMAAAKGFPAIAEAVQELTPLVAAEFLEWFRAR